MNRREAALALALVLAGSCADEVSESAAVSDKPKKPAASRPKDGVVPNEDPAPEYEEPGTYTCKGCPSGKEPATDEDLGEVTSKEFTGNVKGADGNGTFHIEGPDGQTIAGTISTKPNGDFVFDAPLFCGEQTIKMVWSNDEGRYVVVRRVTTSGCTEPALRVTLAWDGLGQDFELHLVREGGRINDNLSDCTWTSCIGSGPDWGVLGDPADDPKKDVDNTGQYGPENIYLKAPSDGTYTVLVEHWNAGGKPKASGNVIINLEGKEVVTIPIDDLPHGSVFTAATITYPGGIVTKVASEYDCSSTWERGCRAPLPAAN